MRFVLQLPGLTYNRHRQQPLCVFFSLHPLILKLMRLQSVDQLQVVLAEWIASCICGYGSRTVGQAGPPLPSHSQGCIQIICVRVPVLLHRKLPRLALQRPVIYGNQGWPSLCQGWALGLANFVSARLLSVSEARVQTFASGEPQCVLTGTEDALVLQQLVDATGLPRITAQ